MAMVKTAALNQDKINKYLEYVGIRGKAVSASSLGIDEADVAIYFPSLDGNSYPGITYSDEPSAQFQTFKLHVFPKETIKNYFLNALSKNRLGQLEIPTHILEPIVRTISESSGRVNPALLDKISKKSAELINTTLAQTHPELGQYEVDAFPSKPIKDYLSKSEEIQAIILQAVYLNNSEKLTNLLYNSVHTELPKHILQNAKHKILDYLSQSFDNQSKIVIARVVYRVIRIRPEFKAYLSSILAKRFPQVYDWNRERTTPRNHGNESFDTESTASVKYSIDKELQMYFDRVQNDEDLAEACKSAVVSFMNEIYRSGMKSSIGLFDTKEEAQSVEIKTITSIVHAVNNSAPEIDLDINKLMATSGNNSVAETVIRDLRGLPGSEFEGVVGESVDIGYNLESLKTLMYTMISNIPAFAQMFSNAAGTPAEQDKPIITKKGDKINIVSFTLQLPQQFSDWEKKIRKDLSNPRVIKQLELLNV
jgi:hypothetical protein